MLPIPSRSRHHQQYDRVSLGPDTTDEATDCGATAGVVSDEEDDRQHPRSPGVVSSLQPVSPILPQDTPHDVADALSRSKLREADQLDVVVYTFADDVCLDDQLHITSLKALDSFFRNDRLPTSKNDFLLLFEDISVDATRVIDQFSNFEQTAAAEHLRGRVNNKQELATHSLHAEKLHNTLFDHYNRDENRDSLTWWRLFSHSRNGYTREREALDECGADTRRMMVPHFELQISDTRKGKMPTKADFRDLSMRDTLSHQWREVRKKARKPNGKDGQKPDGDDEPDSEALEFSANIHRLVPHTYRPHQVVTETIDEKWGTAAEERITCSWFEYKGSTFYILLFDKPRVLHEIEQHFRHGESTDSNPGEPTLSYEEHLTAHPTFLLPEKTGGPSRRVNTRKSSMIPSSIGRYSTAVGSPQPRRRRRHDHNTTPLRPDSLEQVPEDEVPKLPKATRMRFIEEATKAGLLRQSKFPIQDREQVLHRVKLAFTKMAAEDWNLVLSQMALTLDDIDSKMSDNTLLQRNALAWRRLLCSWRVSLVEYATRLDEVNGKLQLPSGTPKAIDGATIDPHAPSFSFGLQSDAYILEEEQSLLRLYQILVGGLHKIEQRVDRSFQAIMSSMSILESEKAIMQGAAITRLTELAFFFIPLSFAATFFSMQIQEYDTHQPNMGHFFAMGITLLVFLYTLRAGIRSTTLTKYKSKLKAEIRKTSRVPGTEDIPTRVIASYVWQRLGALTQTIIIVLPFLAFTLILIAVEGHGKVFKGVGAAIVTLGAATVTVCLIFKRMLAAMRTTVIIVWLLSVLGACIGGKTRPIPGVLGTICTIVTTVCGIILALIPQRIFKRPWKRLSQALLPVWLVLLPFTILLQYHYRDHWKPYQLVLGTLTLVITFGLQSGFIYSRDTRWFFQLMGMCALILGIPMTLAWTVWPMAPLPGDKDDKDRSVHLPYEIQVMISAFSSALFLVLAPVVLSKTYRRSSFWWGASCFIVLFALPITLVWYVLPQHGPPPPLWAKITVTTGVTILCPIAAIAGGFSGPLPRVRFLIIAAIVVVLPVSFVWAVTPLPNIPDISLQAKISVTLGSILVLSLLVRLMSVFQGEGWRMLSWMSSGTAMTIWLPLLIWETKWEVFEPLRRKKTTAIHVTWSTSLALALLWVYLWRGFFSTRNTWTPTFRREKKKKEGLLESTD